MSTVPKKLKRGLRLEPLQEVFLERLAEDPGAVESALKESHVGSARLARWLGQHDFRTAYFQMCAAYEEMFLPAVVAHLREMAMSRGEKGADKWAKLYLEVMKERAAVTVPNDTRTTIDAEEFSLDADEVADLET